MECELRDKNGTLLIGFPFYVREPRKDSIYWKKFCFKCTDEIKKTNNTQFELGRRGWMNP